VPNLLDVSVSCVALPLLCLAPPSPCHGAVPLRFEFQSSHHLVRLTVFPLSSYCNPQPRLIHLVSLFVPKLRFPSGPPLYWRWFLGRRIGPPTPLFFFAAVVVFFGADGFGPRWLTMFFRICRLHRSARRASASVFTPFFSP